MSNTLIIIVLVLILLLAMFVLPQFFIRRAIKKVIRILRENNAVGARNAKFVDELGLQSKGMLENLMRPRDYKPRALQLLISSNIVQMTDDSKVYLSEENLAATRWYNA
jgi:hypothetical protein